MIWLTVLSGVCAVAACVLAGWAQRTLSEAERLCNEALQAREEGLEAHRQAVRFIKDQQARLAEWTS